MRFLRQLFRRKVRTSLTIVGITIGIWALVVFSAMANKIDALVAGGSQYFDGKVIVTDASGGGMGMVPMRMSDIEQIRQVHGVAVVQAQAILLFDEELRASFGPPSQIMGEVAGSDEGLEDFQVEVMQGRGLTVDDEGASVVVVGSDLARKLEARIGDTIELHGTPFEVVGILGPTLTTPDNNAFTPLAAAQALLHEDLPAVIRASVEPSELASQAVVFPEAGVALSELAERIEAGVPNTATLTGDEFDEIVGSSMAIFNAIIIGVALISLVVGGLSVINTMAMSVAERTREIGIKRAIGGSRGRIVRELLAESGAIGLLGGLLGLGLGTLVVVVANEAGRASGTVLFQMTPQTAIFAVGFSTILGTVAGLIPAWNASRLDPVNALRYQ